MADAARKAGVACVFVRLITREKDETPFLHEWKVRHADGQPLPRGHARRRICRTAAAGGELVFSKKRYNAFIGTALDVALRGEGIDAGWR